MHPRETSSSDRVRESAPRPRADVEDHRRNAYRFTNSQVAVADDALALADIKLMTSDLMFIKKIPGFGQMPEKVKNLLLLRANIGQCAVLNEREGLAVKSAEALLAGAKTKIDVEEANLHLIKAKYRKIIIEEIKNVMSTKMDDLKNPEKYNITVEAQITDWISIQKMPKRTIHQEIDTIKSRAIERLKALKQELSLTQASKRYQQESSAELEEARVVLGTEDTMDKFIDRKTVDTDNTTTKNHAYEQWKIFCDYMDNQISEGKIASLNEQQRRIVYSILKNLQGEQKNAEDRDMQSQDDYEEYLKLVITEFIKWKHENE